MSDRYVLKAGDVLTVVDWSKVGPLYYGEITEDGERPVLAPDREAIIQLETRCGQLWNLVSMSFGTDFEDAEAVVAQIVQTGSVNLDLWAFVRNVYGSAAYLTEEFMMTDEERAGEYADRDVWAERAC